MKDVIFYALRSKLVIIIIGYILWITLYNNLFIVVGLSFRFNTYCFKLIFVSIQLVCVSKETPYSLSNSYSACIVNHKA